MYVNFKNTLKQVCKCYDSRNSLTFPENIQLYFSDFRRCGYYENGDVKLLKEPVLDKNLGTPEKGFHLQ